MADLTAEPGRMDGLAGRVDAAATGVARDVDGLATAAGVLGERWTGAAQEAFAAAHAGWTGQMTHLEEVLAAAAQAVRTASAAYERADEAVARAWSL